MTIEDLVEAWVEMRIGARAIQIHIAGKDTINGYGWSVGYVVALTEARSSCSVCGQPLNSSAACPVHPPHQAWSVVIAGEAATLEQACEIAGDRLTAIQKARQP